VYFGLVWVFCCCFRCVEFCFVDVSWVIGWKMSLKWPVLSWRGHETWTQSNQCHSSVLLLTYFVFLCSIESTALQHDSVLNSVGTVQHVCVETGLIKHEVKNDNVTGRSLKHWKLGQLTGCPIVEGYEWITVLVLASESLTDDMLLTLLLPLQYHWRAVT